MKRLSIIVIGIVILALLGVAGFIVFERPEIRTKETEEIVCTMDAKLCPDGSYVSRSGPKCEFASCPSVPIGNALVRLAEPEANAVIRSPITIRGEAKGNWYFEGSFPVRLLDGNGDVLGVVVAQALGEWMTTDFVPFEATISFPAPETGTGTLVLEKDNPSGLPENADELRVPVRFVPLGR